MFYPALSNVPAEVFPSRIPWVEIVLTTGINENRISRGMLA